MTDADLHHEITDFITAAGAEGVLLADGFEHCFVGLGQQFSSPPVAVYDRDACVALLMARDGMSAEDAEEFFAFNVAGAYVGPQTPMFLRAFPSTPVELTYADLEEAADG